MNGQNVGNPQGYVATNTAYLQDFAYNLATRYKGQVYYYGPMNEPNFSSNFNPSQQGLSDPSHQYLNYYMQYLVNPFRSAIKSANAANKLVGPDASLSAGAQSGANAWIYPLNEYFSSAFDVWFVHDYRSNSVSVMNNVNNLVNQSHPIWLTETGFIYNSSQAGYVQDVYVDEYNRNSWWAKTFYHDLYDGSGPYGLTDQNLNPTQSFIRTKVCMGISSPTGTSNRRSSDGHRSSCSIGNPLN